MNKTEVCPTCGTVLRDLKTHAFQIVVQDNSSVAGEQRMVTGNCPTCGPRMTQRGHMGHHSTEGERRMKKLFGLDWKKVRSNLKGSDRKKFTKAMHGQVHASEEEVAGWLAMIVSK